MEFGTLEFVNRLRARDANALSEVVNAYTEHLFRAAIGLGFDRNSARELTQSVWFTFLDKAPTFEGRSHVRTFLFGILYNKAAEMRRDSNRFESPDPVEEVLEKRFNSRGHWIRPPVDPEAFLAASETMSLIEKCLDGLPLAQRMAFSLREVEEFESAEICETLKVTATHLGVLLFRARNRLRECVERKSK